MIIDGRKIAKKILKELKKLPKPDKSIAAVLAGDNPISISFLNQKRKMAARLGISFDLYQFDENVTAEMLRQKIEELSRSKTVGGIIVQLPLPSHLDQIAIIDAIDPQKDIDALRGSTLVMPPAVGAVRAIFQEIGFDASGKKAVILGRGFLVGKPIAEWLKDKVAGMEIFGRDADEEKLKASLKNASLIITGVGKPGLVNGGDIKDGAALIDFGYSMIGGRLAGDIDLYSCKNRASYLTPTPGGTGPILIACIFRNFYNLQTGL